jgi:methylated-DNA-[protein]-cysteine S-methyltransferase
MEHILLIYTIWESPIGPLGLASTRHGLCRVGIGIEEEKFTRQLAEQYRCQPLKSPTFFNLLEKKFTDYFNRTSQRISCPLDLRGGTHFQLKVWKKLTDIPYGETRSYRWVAEQIGQPQACRAVGRASSANPLPIIIPCHRVIKTDGQLGGYTAGKQIKRQLLKLEGCII